MHNLPKVVVRQCPVEMGQSSVNAEARPKNAGECLAGQPVVNLLFVIIGFFVVSYG